MYVSVEIFIPNEIITYEVGEKIRQGKIAKIWCHENFNKWVKIELWNGKSLEYRGFPVVFHEDENKI